MACRQKEAMKRHKPKTILRCPDLEHSKNTVVNSLAASSQESHRHAIDEFIGWYCSESRLAFNRTVVFRYRFFLQQKNLAPSMIDVRLAAIGRLAYEASDSVLLAPELAAIIRGRRGKAAGTKDRKLADGGSTPLAAARTLSGSSQRKPRSGHSGGSDRLRSQARGFGWAPGRRPSHRDQDVQAPLRRRLRSAFFTFHEVGRPGPRSGVRDNVVEGRSSYTRDEGRSTMDALAEKLDGRLREWKPETAAEARERIAEVIELADRDILDIARSRAAEQEVLDLLDEPATR